MASTALLRVDGKSVDAKLGSGLTVLRTANLRVGSGTLVYILLTPGPCHVERCESRAKCLRDLCVCTCNGWSRLFVRRKGTPLISSTS